MPKGRCTLNNHIMQHDQPWCLPAIVRFNHVNGILPYSGDVDVINNSCVLGNDISTMSIKFLNFPVSAASRWITDFVFYVPTKLSIVCDTTGV